MNELGKQTRTLYRDNICLALYALISFSIHLLLMGISPPREPYA